MSDYSLPLQKLLVDTLRVKGLSVFDRVPKGAPSPYVSIGPSDEVEDDAECVEAVVVTQQLDVWSTEPGFVRSREIAATIRTALHRRDLQLAGPALVEIEVRSVRYMRDPDGLTSHAAISIRALIERE
ncbi:DUF3168 domain-containing protein [Aureimonas altamirensis]|uniref:DUF3168 domain-containing protein n=1 Tax=Aureimonas altamirensis TaxID=370622 RepID=UPI001E438F38|nr:DUF3168 domain-containing protein [Aureimonas altamirensis]UHD44913.1 DUF3168 domain-containing protein [Aureimonas altamirensis]